MLILTFYGVYLVIAVIGIVLVTLIAALVYIYRRTIKPLLTSQQPANTFTIDIEC